MRSISERAPKNSAVPVEIQPSFRNDARSRAGSAIFDRNMYAERAALLLLNGVVYTTWTPIATMTPIPLVSVMRTNPMKATCRLDITRTGKGCDLASGCGPGR